MERGWYRLLWAPPTQSCFLLETYSEFDSNWGSAPSSIGQLGLNDITAEHMFCGLKHFWDCGCEGWLVEGAYYGQRVQSMPRSLKYMLHV